MRLAHELTSWDGVPVAELCARWSLPQLHVLNATGSTNDDARVLAEQGAPSGTTVIAERQTAGRGRRGRRWYGSPGLSLHFSMLLRAPTTGFRCLSATPVRVGLIALHALRDQIPLAARLKWPNDLQLSGRKLGGILCESVLGQEPFLVVGIGINIGQDEADFPDDLRGYATSLALETHQPVSRCRVAGALARHLYALASRIAEPFDRAELDALTSSDALRGHAIEIDGEAVGTALGINEEGALLVHTGHGIREIRTGTVRVADAVS